MRTKRVGFTLIELLVAMAIVSILCGMSFSLGLDLYRQAQFRADVRAMKMAIAVARGEAMRRGVITMAGTMQFTGESGATNPIYVMAANPPYAPYFQSVVNPVWRYPANAGYPVSTMVMPAQSLPAVGLYASATVGNNATVPLNRAFYFAPSGQLLLQVYQGVSVSSDQFYPSPVDLYWCASAPSSWSNNVSNQSSCVTITRLGAVIEEDYHNSQPATVPY